MRLLLPLALLAVSCAGPRATTAPSAPKPAAVAPHPKEVHLKNLRQLTFGGENAEAYWRFDGKGLSLQARQDGEGCDRIHTLSLETDPPTLRQLSSGKGATTCAHWFPDGESVLYASTHLGGDACPPKPDMSQGYVWALYDSYDVFKVKQDGSALTRLTDTPGYDAEGTVCAKDGSIVFTSVRDGDLELYRMDADGKNVKRLTFEPGYDGGAFFNADCTKLVWRASRPKPGKELEEYQALLKKGLVRPSRLELFVANADGSDAHQVTYLGSASFAPFFTPKGDRILFSTNYPNPRGREFDIWAVNVDGTGLERVTHAPGFDGFPMFSPDGKTLAFSSNRATAPGRNDTNLFLADWVDAPPVVEAETAADRLARDVAWLADPAREGRGVGTKGLEAAGAWLEERFRALGLEPLGEQGTFRQHFDVVTAVESGPATALGVGGAAVAKDDFTPVGWSGQGKVEAPLVFAGYGLDDADLGLDDFKGLDVKGKVVLVRRFVPDHPKLQTPEAQRKAGDLRKKAFAARSRGAVALLVVDAPPAPEPAPKDWQAPPDAKLPALRPEGTGDAGLPVVVVKRAALEKTLAALLAKKKVRAKLQVELRFQTSRAFNVVGRVAAKAPAAKGVTVVGAHYDHLGYGGPESLTPDRHEPHLGADDNASGTAALLEVARALAAERDALPRDVVVAAFSGEESGVMGSSALVKAHPELFPAGSVMLNMDMVGRLRQNQLQVLGSDSADGWLPLLEAACDAAKVRCAGSGDGYGPSDQTPFYAAGLPVLHFFTGAHSDYHKPSDAPARINAAGAARTAQVVAQLAKASAQAPLVYKKVPTPAGKGDARSFGASLGTVPDYGGPPPGIKGVLLSDVRPGGGAELGGMRRGDVIVKLGKADVLSVEDLMYVLMSSKPGETVTAVVLRDGQKVELSVTFQEGRRR